MPNTVVIKNSDSPSAVPASLANGELALNRATGKLYYKNTLNQVVELTGATGAGGVSDGDKGDIVVSGSGSTWSIDSTVLSNFARTLIDDTTASAARATLQTISDADSRLTDSREWSAATVTQADAEAGTATSRVAWTVQRVWQAIAAWWAASAAKTKLDGIATGATANSTDAQLRDRTTHTGVQAISTVNGLQTALDGKAAAAHTHDGSSLTRTVQSASSTTQTLSPADRYLGVVSVLLTSNITLTLPSVSNGAAFHLLLRQDATGGRAVSFSNATWPTGSAPAIPTSPSTFAIVHFLSDGVNWYGTAITPLSTTSLWGP